jgi:hypothetical protein
VSASGTQLALRSVREMAASCGCFGHTAGVALGARDGGENVVVRSRTVPGDVHPCRGSDVMFWGTRALLLGDLVARSLDPPVGVVAWPDALGTHALLLGDLFA